MRVLLVSPLPGIDPACVDVVYTQTLLAYPPEGVVYETYADALKRGALVEHGRRNRFRKEPFLTLFCKLINIARSRHWLFWEPFRIFSVRPGEYDLIHIHVFSAGFRNPDCPLVISNAAPQRFLYTEARGWSQLRTGIVEYIEIFLARGLRINHVSYRIPQAARVVAFTDFLRRWYTRNRIAPENRVDVVPIYLPLAPVESELKQRPSVVGFIAKDFYAKGGDTLLAAFEIVRNARSDAKLLIVGCRPQLKEPELSRRAITWLPYVAREKLLTEIIPSFDVFAYPTRFDGMPLVVLEAMAAGVPVATSDYQAMPEIVGAAGLVSPTGDAPGLAKNILSILEPDANPRLRNAAAARFRNAFSTKSVAPLLYRTYRQATGTRTNPQAAKPQGR